MRATTAIESNISSKQSWIKFYYKTLEPTEFWFYYSLMDELQDLFDELDRAKCGFELIKEPK